MGKYMRHDRRACFICQESIPDNRYIIHLRKHTKEEREESARKYEGRIYERMRIVEPGWKLEVEGEGETVQMVRIINAV